MTVIDGLYEWDSEKNEANFKKHGLEFGEIVPIFDDPFFLEVRDDVHSDLEEDRFMGIGMLPIGLLVVTVIYAERERIRIISARPASKKERSVYVENARRLSGN